ncbi:hypothetical protein ACFV84_36195 [Kitasatospora sp. NPDC059811]|uniref:hypothetical protein n=1 Tax=Streptomycetaceae TaxID=2062 RepID=UPI0007AFD2A9|nr:hypothetical protein [Streptomyces sp. MJM8645]
MNIHKLLRDDAEELGRELEGHDPLASLRRLAVRIAEGERPAPTRTVGRSGRTPAAPRTATAPPVSAARAPQKREHLDVVAASGRADLRRDLEHLCAAVVSEAPPESIADTLAGLDCDEAAARVVGCLMYLLGQSPWAEFWWGVAAGADDELAAHLLAVHFAGTGHREKAGIWQRRATEVAEDALPVRGAVCPDGPAEAAKVLTVHVEGAGEQALLDIVERWPATPPTVTQPQPAAVGTRRVARGRPPRRRLVEALSW